MYIKLSQVYGGWKWDSCINRDLCLFGNVALILRWFSLHSIDGVHIHSTTVHHHYWLCCHGSDPPPSPLLSLYSIDVSVITPSSWLGINSIAIFQYLFYCQHSVSTPSPALGIHSFARSAYSLHWRGLVLTQPPRFNVYHIARSEYPLQCIVSLF